MSRVGHPFLLAQGPHRQQHSLNEIEEKKVVEGEWRHGAAAAVP